MSTAMNLSRQINLINSHLAEFKELYKKTRNYTLLSEKHDDVSIFGGLVYGSGFACVYSAWEVFIGVKQAYVVPDIFSHKLDQLQKSLDDSRNMLEADKFRMMMMSNCGVDSIDMVNAMDWKILEYKK